MRVSTRGAKKKGKNGWPVRYFQWKCSTAAEVEKDQEDEEVEARGGEGGEPKKFMSYSSGLLEPNARRISLRSTGLCRAPLR